jgi:hypothetical protein
MITTQHFSDSYHIERFLLLFPSGSTEVNLETAKRLVDAMPISAVLLLLDHDIRNDYNNEVLIINTNSYPTKSITDDEIVEVHAELFLKYYRKQRFVDKLIRQIRTSS